MSQAAAPLTLHDYMALTGPEPNAHVAYGAAPSQYAELFRPPGIGPFPVVLLVHGGCWRKEYAGIEQMRAMAGALVAQGIAVWNVEYRRVDETGGGFPGMFLDVAAALDLLVSQAAANQLDVRRLVAVGHSAGGHLVQWLAGRVRLQPSSPLYQAQPFELRRVIALGSIGDLRARQDHKRQVCGVDVAKLTGDPSAARADVYADTSPAEMVPNGSHTVLINGALDTVSPPQTALDYALRARRAGDAIDTLTLPGASHYDEVSPASPSWPAVLRAIREALALH